MLKKFLKHCEKPEGFFGKLVITSMNRGHAPFFKWMMQQVQLGNPKTILDVGCGGGGNIALMFKMFPDAKIDGVDYSEVSVAQSIKFNKDKIGNKCEIKQGDAMKLPFEDEQYDLVTAVETIYFWSDPLLGCRELYRVLKKDGKVIIGCEANDPEKSKLYTNANDAMVVYTPEQLKKFLNDAGFTDVKSTVKGIYVVVQGSKN